MRKLESSPYFITVDLIDSRLTPREGVPVQKFAVLVKLRRQSEDAAAWRDKCLGYFQRFSQRPYSK